MFRKKSFAILFVCFFPCWILLGAQDSKPWNVILITVDTLRADHLEPYGYTQIRTPHISRLAQRGAVFEHVIASSPLTLPSHASILTGTFPFYHGVQDNVGFILSEDQITLAEVLSESGFVTGAGHLLGGWQINAIIPLQTGLPFSVINGASLRGGGDFNADGKAIERPNTPVFGNKLNNSPGTSEFIDGVLQAEAFPSPEPGTSGNLGKNTFTGPAFWSMDFSLFKNFPIPVTEDTMLQFRAEFFNLFNRVNLFLPQVDLDSSLLGMSNTAFDPREIQFALKFIF